MKTDPSTICNPQLVHHSASSPAAVATQKDPIPTDHEERRKQLSLKRKALFAKIPKGFSEILIGKLWLGSGRDARQKQKLQELGITHIVNCAIEWKNHYPSSFIYLNGNVLDNEGQDLSVFFSEAFDFLDDVFKVPSHRVFIHCVVGKSRSAALTMAYLMRSQHLTLKHAYNHVKACRPIVCPNDGFMRQLMTFEMHIFKTKQSSLVWGDWKNQSKCALAPPPFDKTQTSLSSSSLTDSPSSINHYTLLQDTDMKENVPLPDSNTTITTTSSSSSSSSKDNTHNDKSTPHRAKFHRTELQQAALDSFVQTHITPELLQKGLTEVCGGVYDHDSVGDLLQWVHHGIRDSTSCAEGVRREGVSWRDVAHSIDETAKQWLRKQELVPKDNIAT